MSIDQSQISYARVLHILREQGASSRAELCRKTGLSAAAITGITRDLIAKGYVQPIGLQSSGRGRPVEILEYDAQSRFALGIELHNHAAFGVVTDLYARPLYSHRIEPVKDGADSVLSAIHNWTQEVEPWLGTKECAAIGIALPGLVNQTTGMIEWTTEFNLPQIPIIDLLEQQLCHRPAVTNRTYAAALAEAWLGAAKEAKNLVYIRMGDYLGGAILVNGLPYWGSASSAGSVAHMTVDPVGLPCRCGSRGCLDTVASGTAMARRAREEIKQGRSSSLEERTGGNLDLITGRMVLGEAAAGDGMALDVLREAGSWLGIAAGICINLLGVDMIVLGGHLGRMGKDLLLEPVYESARAHAYSLPMRSVQIVTSALGEEAVACGAAATALWATLTQSLSLHVG
jgi:N-acetylglucosamine repressor